MADAQIQGLEFKIEENSSNADSNLGKLADTLGRLKSAVKGNGLSSLANSLQKLSNVKLDSGLVDTLGKLGEAVSKLSNAKVSPAVSKNIENIANSANSITDESIDKINRLADALKGMDGLSIPKLGNSDTTKTPTVPTDNAGTQAAQAVQQGAGVTDAGTSMASGATEATKLSGVLEGVHSVATKVGSSFQSLGSAIKGAVGQGVTNLASALKDKIASLGSTVASTAKSAAQLGVSLGGHAFQSIGTAVSAPFKALGNLKDGFENCKEAATGLLRSFGRIAMYRAIRSFFSALTGSIKEGINNLYQYSSLMGGTFKGSMDSLATSFQYLKNSMGAMVAPLLQAIAPAVDYLISKFVALLNVVNQFFARLTGASVYTRAKKATASYGDTLSKTGSAAKEAAKDIKDATVGIDELNIIQQKDDTGSGSGGGAGAGTPDYGSMFETVPIDSTIKDFTDKLKDAIDKGDWKAVGTLLGNKFNEIVDSIDWKGWGAKLGYGINGAVQSAYWFLKVADFYNLGKHIAEFLNSAMEQIDFSYLGRLLVVAVTDAIDFVIGFLGNLDWGLVAKSLSDFFIGAFDEVTDWLNGYDWSKLGQELWQNIKDFFSNIDYAGLAKSFFTMLGTAFRSAALFLGGFFGSIGKDIKEWWDNDIKGQNWKETASNLLSAIGEGFKNIGGWVMENIVDPFMDALVGKDNWDDAKKAAKDIWDGFTEGIKAFFDDPIGFIKEHIVDPFINGIKEKLGIHSPSTVMKEIGENVIEGLKEGLLAFPSKVMSDVKQWGGKLIDWFTGGDSGKNVVERFKDKAGEIVDGFKDKIGNTYTTVKTNISTWGGKIKDWFSEHVNKENWETYASDTVNGFKDKVGSTYNTVKTNVTTWASKVKDWFSSEGGVNRNTFSDFANNTIEGFRTKVGTAYTNTKTNITTWAGKVKDWFTSDSYGGVNNNRFQTFANDTIEGFRTKVGNAYTNTRSNMQTWATNVKSWFNSIASNGAFSGFANDVISGFRDKVGSAYTNTRSNMQTWATNVKNWFSDIASNSAFGTFASNVINGFKDKIGRDYTTAKGNMTNFANSVKSWFENPDGYTLASKFTEIGKNVIQGFIDGVNSLWDTAMNKIKDFGKKIIGKGKEGTQEASPSKAFKKIGAFVIEGFNIGLDDVIPDSYRIMDSWLKNINGYQPQLAYAVDTSSVTGYDASRLRKSVSAQLDAQAEVSMGGIEPGMEEFYRNYVEPTLLRIANGTEKQADKADRTIVQIGNRVISDAVVTQQKANGYNFTK